MKMFFYTIRLFFIIIALVMSRITFSAPVDKLVIFGDSLSDIGNLYKFTQVGHSLDPNIPIIPQSPPYYQGRFSNGSIWVEELANLYKLDVSLEKYFYNNAYGGAWIEPYSESGQFFPFDVGMQISQYLGNAIFDFDKANHLYIILGGGNDYLVRRSDINEATNKVIKYLKKNINLLLDFGAQNILIPNLPDLGKIPLANTDENYKKILSDSSLMHNQKLAIMLLEVQKNHPRSKIILFDTEKYFEDIYANPAKYHLTNVTTACLEMDNLNFKMPKGFLFILNNPALRTSYLSARSFNLGQKICENPDNYLFWDAVHPTHHAHQLMAQEVFLILKNNGLEN